MELKCAYSSCAGLYFQIYIRRVLVHFGFGSYGGFRVIFAVVKQRLKKCCGDKLVLGWFFVLGFVASVGCGFKSTGKYGQVPGGTGPCGKREKAEQC